MISSDSISLIKEIAVEWCFILAIVSTSLVNSTRDGLGFMRTIWRKMDRAWSRFLMEPRPTLCPRCRDPDSLVNEYETPRFLIEGEEEKGLLVKGKRDLREVI